MKCSRCGREFEQEQSLRKHVGRTHKISSEEFYIELKLNGVEPTCECGCGQRTSYRGWGPGFLKWIVGHNSKGDNNPSCREDVKRKRSEFWKENNPSKINPWQKGLTKETDERVAKQAEKLKGREILWKDKISKTRKKRLASGEIVIPSGRDSYNWKGGKSSIRVLIYSNKRLHEEWKKDKFVFSNGKCSVCSAKYNLTIHHDKITMSKIISKFVKSDHERYLTFEEKKNIVEKVVDYHVNNDVSGIVLCMKCHKRHHRSFNFRKRNSI